MAKTGSVKDLYPEGNDGSMDGGAGEVTEDGTGKVYVFLTIDGVVQTSVPLSKGTKVTFDALSSEEATHVQKQ